MNITAYNLDSLRRLVRSLLSENRRLKEQLKSAKIPYEAENIFLKKIENMEEYDPDQGERILRKEITEDLANKFFVMFWGRMDVYAKRGRLGWDMPISGF
jgi:hypothetical protein